MVDTTTRGVRVAVQSRYHPERSDPARNEWFFSYTVHISNVGDQVVQLLSRHWVITDASGGLDEVQGPGVIGEQPVLQPGESFTYTSFCPLPTSLGAMHGTYGMRDANGDAFDAVIPAFGLVDPSTEN